MKKTLATCLLLLLALPVRSRADEPRPEKSRSSFRLDYVLYEVESGRRANEKSFSMTVNEGAHGLLRSGSRVPVYAGDKGVQFLDVGLKIGARVLERDGDLTLDSEIEMSNFAVPEQPAGTRGEPVVRTVSGTVSVRPVPGKAALVASVDDLAGRKRLQVEVTVTRLR